MKIRFVFKAQMAYLLKSVILVNGLIIILCFKAHKLIS